MRERLSGANTHTHRHTQGQSVSIMKKDGEGIRVSLDVCP